MVTVETLQESSVWKIQLDCNELLLGVLYLYGKTVIHGKGIEQNKKCL